MTVRTGQIHGLIGPNGSGKSTAVNVISGLYAPTSGDILLQGKSLPKGSLFKVARTGVSRTFQNLQLFGELSALDNVMLALKGVYRSPLPLCCWACQSRGKTRAGRCARPAGAGRPATHGPRPRQDLTYGSQRFLRLPARWPANQTADPG